MVRLTREVSKFRTPFTTEYFTQLTLTTTHNYLTFPFFTLMTIFDSETRYIISCQLQ